jgi:outer membrane protein OmpA-like peptidoglycan-associated protein
MNHRKDVAVVIALALAAVLTVGCATKKYVRETTAPVQQKVDVLEKKSAGHDTSIAELEKGVSRADERAQGADNRAGAAAREAAKANEQASAASKDAGAAQATADKGVAQAGEAQRSVGTLGTKVENMDNYKLSSTETVLFNLNQSELTDEAKAQLDAAVTKLSSMKHYVVEVQGFTDSTGDAAMNLELSRRRAAAVVRYLTLEKKIPLYRVNTIGYGEESPSADNKTRDGRKQNRRVEVRFYVPDLGV